MELDADLVLGNDMPLERARARQSRPDVLLELGMALVAYPQNSVVVEVGQLRPLSVSWLHGRLLRGDWQTLTVSSALPPTGAVKALTIMT